MVDNNPLIKKLAPHETEIFHIKPANPTRPQYIGSDLHFSCGFEVRSFVFGEGHVSICLKNDYEKKGSIYLYLPGSDESLNTVAVTANGKPGTAAVVAKPNIGVHTEGSNQPTHFYQGRVLQVRVSIEASGAENDGKVSFTW